MNFMKNCHWIILGPEQSWKTSLKQNGIWGVKSILYPEWKALDPKDIIFFYVTKTVKGVIGVGKIETKFVQDRPLWPDEIAENKVIYPLRFEFKIDYLLGEQDWKKNKISIGLSIQEMRRGINLLQDKTIDELYKLFNAKFNYRISPNKQEEPEIARGANSKSESQSLNHTKIQDLVYEIGRLNRVISEKEYPMENERLDVVWRKVERSVPTYVFEIQVGGDIYHALGKLKHAFDLWNSNIFLVAKEEDIAKAQNLLNGTFHEIKDKIKIINIEKIYELYEQKRKWIDMEKEIGLIQN